MFYDTILLLFGPFIIILVSFTNLLAFWFSSQTVTLYIKSALKPDPLYFSFSFIVGRSRSTAAKSSWMTPLNVLVSLFSWFNTTSCSTPYIAHDYQNLTLKYIKLEDKGPSGVRLLAGGYLGLLDFKSNSPSRILGLGYHFQSRPYFRVN